VETVRTRSAVVNLLIGSGMEVHEVVLASDERITLLPPDPGREDAVELYYVLSGQLGCLKPETSEPLSSGDYVITLGLTEEAILSAMGEVRLLYFTTQPFFHEISGVLQELMRLAVEVELKDGYTAEHCLRLQKLSFATGSALGLGSHRLYLLDRGSYLHDVGKVRVPVEILQKPAALTADEWKVIRQHPTFGREMLEPTVVRDAGQIVEQHHERFDGSGYPYGLKGDEILAESYIVAIADTYDAMTTDRVYRAALPPSEAKEELLAKAGVLYPRELVRAFLAVVDGVEPAA
jgi:HD-GYP domain-containing protein (c-di-GMP phosphodiesterase class II)